MELTAKKVNIYKLKQNLIVYYLQKY
ncbi:MAG: hypothetical protein ACJAWQ_001283, partial [Paraglaciecola sp.]